MPPCITIRSFHFAYLQKMPTLGELAAFFLHLFFIPPFYPAPSQRVRGRPRVDQRKREGKRRYIDPQSQPGTFL